MAFQREKQNIPASQLLRAIADGDDIQLNRCTITGTLDVNRLFEPAEKFQIEKVSQQQEQDRKILKLSQSIVFDKCTFENNVIFSGPWSEPESITVEFSENIVFNSSVFKGQLRFRDAVFCGTASFDGCTFGGVVTFKNATFYSDCQFRTVTFNGYSLFGEAIFNKSAKFTNSHFVKGANFSHAKFEGQIDFGGVYSSSRAIPSCNSIFFNRHRYGEDESFWRFAKQSAQEAGYYQLAGEYFYSERCARLRQKFTPADYDTLSPPKKFIKRVAALRFIPELIFGRFLFGYGERPTRVLVASALVIFVCAFLYSQPNLLIYRAGPNVESFRQGLYFSMITFTTLGYGDLYPNPDSYCRLIAMAEAISGGCLMALFVVCLAKRFSRG